ncbi:MAG: DUF2341 domain-containing protein [Patescibacteria group bacterium]|jgi:hypothetical protein
MKKFRILFVVALSAVVLFVTLLLYLYFSAKSARAAWFDDSWRYRVEIPISAHTAAENNVYLSLTGADGIDTTDTTKFQPDCGDIRFMDSNGNLLPYFLTTACGLSQTGFHVLFNEFPSGTQTIYYYYGNASVPNGFSSQDFTSPATGVTLGTRGSETNSPVSPIAIWEFDEGTGQVINNTIGVVNTGTLGPDNTVTSTDPSWATEDMCAAGKCLSFAGSNSQYVNFSNSVAAVKSIGFWIRPTSTTTSVAVLNGAAGNASISISSGTISTGAGFATPTVYVNGVISSTIAANTWQYVVITTETGITASNIMLGRVNTGYFNGFMDGVKIYGTALSSAQIKANYAAGMGQSGTIKGSAVSLGSNSQGGINLTNGLVGYWKMDESSGNVADASGNSMTGTVTGTTAVSGKFGNARSFTGTDQIAVSSISGVKTIGFWLYVTNTTTDIIRLSTSPTTNITAAGTLSATGFTDPLMYVDGVQTTTLSANVWQYVAVTSQTGITADGILLGRVSSALIGYLDEVRIYNRTLTQKDIVDLHNFSPGPVGYWKMDEGTGTTVYDAGGNGYSGTFGSGSSAPTWEEGRIGHGLNFKASGSSGSVTIQPDSTAGADTYLGDCSADTNFGTETFVTLENAGCSHVGVIKFDLSSLPVDAVVTSATLTLEVISAGGTQNIVVNRILSGNSSWTETGATWNNQVGTTPWAGSGGCFTSGTDYSSTLMGSVTNSVGSHDITLDTAEVNSMIASNNGMRLFSDGFFQMRVASSEDSTPSIRPKLVINYSSVTDQYFATGNQTFITGNSSTYKNVSWGGWIKPKTTATSRTIIHKGNEFRLTTDATAKANCSIYASSWQTPAVATDALPTNSWSHVMCTYDGENVRVYVNGMLSGSVAQTNSVVSTNTTALNVGRDVDNSSYFVGNLDEVRIYNYTRTSRQIAVDMSGAYSGAGLAIGIPAGYWKMDEQQGQSLNNANTSGAITASLGTTSGSESQDPVWKTGSSCKVNGCLSLDGTDDLVTVSNVAGIDFDNNLHSGFTISAWINPDTAGEGSGGRIFYKGTNTWLRVDTLSGGKMDIEASVALTSTNATANCSSVIVQSAWNHVALSYTDDIDDEITISVNGKPVCSSVDGGGAPAANDTSDLLIGGDSSNNFDGRIDEFKIFSFALSPNDLQSEANFGLAASLGGALGTHTNEGFGATEPIAWWKFDENNGMTAYDSGGSNLNLTLDTGASFANGKSGSALSGNGSGNVGAYKTDGTGSLLDLAGDFTVSFWMRATSIPDYAILVSKGDTGTDTDNNYACWLMNNNDRISCYVGNGIGGFSTVTTLLHGFTPTANSWIHIEFVHTFSNRYLYINGQIVDVNIDDVTPAVNNGDFTIGGRQYDFPGLIDEVKIYDYARTQAQVAYDYNRGAPVSWLKMNECSGNILHNSVLNGNDQALGLDGEFVVGGGTQSTMGTCTTSGTTPWYGGRNGKYASSVNLDGSDDYIRAGNLLVSITGGTAALWVKPSTTPGSDEMLMELSASPTMIYLTRAASTAHFVISLGSTAGENTSIIIPSNEWTHIALVWNNGTYYAYLNGKQVRTNSYSGLTSITGTYYYIGSLDGTGANLFTGQVDDARVFNYPLSADMIKKLHNEGFAGRFGPATGSP